MNIANANDCFAISDPATIPLETTGIKENSMPGDVKIYPNPTLGMFTIEMNNNLFGELITRIFSQNAVEILNIKFHKSTQHFIAHVDLSGQGKGVYLISFTLDKYKADRKIIVE